jgi:hypothetical protein
MFNFLKYLTILIYGFMRYQASVDENAPRNRVKETLRVKCER